MLNLFPLLFAQDEASATAGDMIFEIAKYTIAALKFGVGIWGLYCIAWMWQHLGRRAFSRRAEEREFVDQTSAALDRGAFEEAEQLASAPKVWLKGIPMLSRFAIQNRHLSHAKLQHLLAIRMDSDVMAGVAESVATVNTCIKTAPMLGLFGTVVGMIQAFGKIATQTSPDASKLSGGIALALWATAGGLFVAVTLLLLINFVIVRKRRVEDATIGGIQQIVTHLDYALSRTGGSNGHAGGGRGDGGVLSGRR
jgi:biopolymer transport protein ExbB